MSRPEADASRLPWVTVRPGLPYFVTEHGAAWTPLGHNDAITWPELAGLFMRRDVPGVERHLRCLRTHGVTCLRVMLEYGQGGHRWLERPAGAFAANMVRLWDDLFALCERVGLYLLLTPFDTFFLWRRWRSHPYHRDNGGPCASRRRLLVCPATRAAIEARLAFATGRWGASPALFAWDLWNELKPQWALGDTPALADFIAGVGGFLRCLETRLHGRAHLQTASVFLPDLAPHPGLTALAFRHPALDFASPHCYERGAIDAPRNTVAPARAIGRLLRESIAETRDGRPVLDTEHGPIRAHAAHGGLPEAFDDAYFRRMQWAHLASGGAGGGLRWPYRHPHVLTTGMREAQRALSAFLPLIDWTRFDRRPCIPRDVAVPDRGTDVFACASADQALAYLLRGDGGRRACLGKRAPRDGTPAVTLALPGLDRGRWRLTTFDPVAGRIDAVREVDHPGGLLAIELHPTGAETALAATRTGLG